MEAHLNAIGAYTQETLTSPSLFISSASVMPQRAKGEIRTRGMDCMWWRGSSQGLKQLKARDKWHDSRLICPQIGP